MITKKRVNWQGLQGVHKDADLISGNKDLENSIDDGALDRDYLSPKLKRTEQQAEIRTLLMPL